MKTTHTTRSIRIAMALLAMLTMTLTASATVTNFISDVMLIGNSSHTSFDNQVSDSVAAGWTDINKDLNAGCGSGSDYIHLLYKTVNSTGSSGFPITGFYIRTGANPPASLTYDERTYYRVPCAGSNNFVNSLGDLNRGAGGEYIFLYYTKDAFSTHESVITITFDNTQDGGVGANGGDTGYNLNEGCSSSAQKIYMHVATQLPEGTTAPQRHLDACTGGENSIHVQGWTFDPDAPWASLDVHVYVYTNASCSSQSQYGDIQILHANVPRSDVNNAYHIVGDHGFEATIPIADAGNYWVKVWAINYLGGSNPQIGATTAVTVTHTVTLTSQSGEVLLQDGDILTGTGGADTHVKIADGATVTLSGMSITDITNDNSHQWAGITCLGDAVIILEGGTTNSVGGGRRNPGIYVPANKTLTLQGSGTLNATGGQNAAGIGSGDESTCGDITISGGTITAIGGKYGAGIGSGYYKSFCGNIAINGGTVTATGGEEGAGIGSGYYQSCCNDITISGGTVMATGGEDGAGIGSGWSRSCCGNITISDGTVTATGGKYATGIGSGHSYCSCGDITISGGIVTATGGESAAGIGSGYFYCSCGDITISGGTVTATSDNGGSGIGSGDNNCSCGDITISGGTVTATGGNYAAGIGSGDGFCSCGNITITNDVTRVTATKGYRCNNAIGSGESFSLCDTITIGGVETGYITQSPFVTFPYTVAFDANDGTGSMDDQILMYNVAQNLNANSFTRAYYLFDGWATSANGEKEFDDEQSVINLADTIATVTLYAKWNYGLTKEIVGYGDVSNPGGWYLIASPVVEAIAPSADNGFITNEYDLYYFDPSFVGEEWRNYETENFLLTNGTGYLYASEIATTLTFTGTLYTGDGEIELAYDSNVPDFGGWNLVGNPYPTTAYVDRDFYVMNNVGSELIPAEGSTVEALEGIFVVADNENDVVHFTPTDPGKTQSKIVLNLTQGRGPVIDRAIVRFDDSRQLPKLMFYESNTKMYIAKGDSDFAVVRSDRSGKLHVNFEPAEDGTYVISTKVKNVAVSSLYLIDHLRGIKVDLLNQPEYEFVAKVTDKPNRFELVYKTGTSSFFQQIISRNDEGEEFGFISDGNLIINNEGKSVLQVIDVTGRILSSETINGSYNKQIDAAPGVYLLRLINGDDVKTQKIVVR